MGCYPVLHHVLEEAVEEGACLLSRTRVLVLENFK